MVSKLGYGCMGLSGAYNSPVSNEDGIAIIKIAFNGGITFFDRSDIYSVDHTNEILVRKEKVQSATKFGIVKVEPTQVVVKGTVAYVRSYCEGSLKRLGVDYIDLYYVHRIDTSVHIEETMWEAMGDVKVVDLESNFFLMGELKKLVEESRIKYIGLSEASPNTIRRAHVVHHITALQIEYSLLTRDIEEEIILLCRCLKGGVYLIVRLSISALGGPSSSYGNYLSRSGELGIVIVPYSPTAHGFFVGKAVMESVLTDSFLLALTKFTGQNLDHNKIFYLLLEELSKKHSCTPVQLALVWVLHQGDDTVPISGTTKIKNLDENIGALRKAHRR
ncbi:unnamed protein product [Camellia sinensis]